MEQVKAKKIRYRGRVAQVWIYLIRALRLCITQTDWKVLPMSALIAGLVAYVVGKQIFENQERTIIGCFAIACVCIWNGCFNSIQVVCRERAILKHEHRSGMHVSSYVVAQMIYQAMICLAQSSILVAIFKLSKVHMPEAGMVTPWFIVDLGISVFLTTFAADMMAFAISSFVHSPTTAMTIMPFLLIFELVFAGAIFSLDGPAKKICDLTTAHWGYTVMVAQGNYNELPFVSAWQQLWNFREVGVDVEGETVYPAKLVTDYMYENQKVWDFEMISARQNAKPEFENTAENITRDWWILVGKAMLMALLACISLEVIDKDKR